MQKLEKEYQKEVAAYTDNYTQFAIDPVTRAAKNGKNSKKITFSNVENALRFQSLLSMLGYSLNTSAEKNVIDELLKNDELSEADKSILLEPSLVQFGHNEDTIGDKSVEFNSTDRYFVEDFGGSYWSLLIKYFNDCESN